MNKKSLVVGLIVVCIVGLNSLLAEYISPAVQIPESVAEEVANYVLSEVDTPPVLIESTFKVVKVVDGDTIDVDIDGEVVRVRYLGIDTPESVIPNKTAECLGTEAASRNRELVEGKYVRLEKDISEFDDYDRLLRHVYVGDVWANHTLIEEGFAEVVVIPPDKSHGVAFLNAQFTAKEERRGIWGDSCQQ